MNSFFASTCTSSPMKMLQNNIDTDQMVPARFLAEGELESYASAFFHDWRFNEDGSEKADSPFRESDYKNQKILITGPNFGCGSSREHAVWAIRDYGFRILIGTSFGDIFRNNCFKNNILAISLLPDQIEFFYRCHKNISVNLENQTIQCDSREFSFTLDPFMKHCLINNMDQMAYIQSKEPDIARFEDQNQGRFVNTNQLLLRETDSMSQQRIDQYQN